jgi:hypothetical protein
VDAAYLSGQRSRLEHPRLRDLCLPRCCAHGLVTAHVGCEQCADDSGRNQREQHARCNQSLLVPSLPRLRTPKLVAGIRVDRLEDVPGRQGVEN